MFSGRIPRAGSLARLKMHLAQQGWDPDVVALVTSPKDDTRARLVEVGPKSADGNVDLRALKEMGFAAKVFQKTHAPQARWDSYGRYPFWLSGSHPVEVVCLAGNWQRAQRMTARLLVDLAGNVAQRNVDEAMPTFRRFSLNTFSSPEGLAAYQAKYAVTTDVTVLCVPAAHPETAYKTLDWFHSISHVSRGLCVLEVVDLTGGVSPMFQGAGVRPIFSLAGGGS